MVVTLQCIKNFKLSHYVSVITLPFLSGIFFTPALYASDAIGIGTIEEALAVATLMSDSEALTFGFANVDLTAVSDDPELGNDDSLSYRNSLDVFVVPYTWKLTPKSDAWEHALTVRAFYIKSQRSLSYSIASAASGEQVDDSGDLQEDTYGAYVNYSQYYHVTDNWYVESALGLHLSYYRNTYKYSNDVDDDIKEQLDNKIFNVSTLALIVEPEVGIGYAKDQQWGAWRLHNNTNYIYGHGIGGSIEDPSKINPEGWRLTNGVEFTVEVPELWGVNDFVTIDFKRIDVLGDLGQMADKGHYYETTFGWIIDTKDKLPLLDNIGIGLSINYGSSLSGGTLVLYYNEEYEEYGDYEE